MTNREFIIQKMGDINDNLVCQLCAALDLFITMTDSTGLIDS